LWRRVSRAVAPKRLLIHATSEDEAREIARHLPAVETVVVRGGVELPTRLDHVPGNGALRLLFLGRVHPIKGLENLLDACRILCDKGREVVLTIAGKGETPYARTLEARLHRLGLTDRVRLVGAVYGPHKRHLFETADVVVVPSHRESFGIVVTEALAHAVPVVASTGTPWGRLVDMGCGVWSANDSATLADAIECLGQRPLREMGLQGRKWMETEFSWATAAQQMYGVYRRLVETS
jgi:glycosyltransferase involved in cell wall biosynthesis